MSVYGIAVLVAPILGPTLGGWITDNYSWRWIFFINMPVGIISLILTSIVVHDPPELERAGKERRKRGVRIDGIGLGLIALGLGSLEVVYAKGQEKDWFGSDFITDLHRPGGRSGSWRRSSGSGTTRTRSINLRLFKERNFAACGVGLYLTFAILYGSTVQMPAMLQDVFGYDATKAGLILSPGGLVTMATMPVIGWMLGGEGRRALADRLRPAGARGGVALDVAT